VVYKNLGFEGFTSLEYMQNVSYNNLNWARDESLLPEILSVLTSGTAPDLIFAVSVQAHGKYPEDWMPSQEDVAVIDLPEKFSRPGFGYFINQLTDIDSFLRSLVTRLQALNKPIILVMYGDHLPGLGILDEDLINEDNQETDYVIWTNMELTPQKKPLYSYQLSAEVLGRLGIQTGGILGLHQLELEGSQLFQDLRLLGYDRLYGQDFVASPEDQTVDSHFHMGQGRIRITQVRRDRDHIYISGKGFTTFSTILVNGKERETSVISPNLLAIENQNVSPQDELSVGQVSRMNAILGSTQAVHLGYIPPKQSSGGSEGSSGSGGSEGSGGI
jgi:hypothetical protein